MIGHGSKEFFKTLNRYTAVITPKNVGDHVYVNVSSLTGASKGYVAKFWSIPVTSRYFSPLFRPHKVKECSD